MYNEPVWITQKVWLYTLFLRNLRRFFFFFPDGFLVKRDPESNDTFDNVTESVEKGANDFFADKIVMLEESDVPGASLNGKKPSQLTVGQLKRRLACRGAPLSGRKPELIQRLASCISFY